MNRNKRFFSVLLGGLLALNTCVPAFAVGTGSSNVTLQVETGEEPSIVSVKVPTEIPLKMDKEGTVAVPQDLSISNLSDETDVELTGLSVTGKNGWMIKAYSEDLAARPEGTKELSMAFRGDETTNSGDVSLTQNEWIVNHSSELLMNVSAKLPRQTAEYKEKGDIAQVNYVFSPVEDAGETPAESVITNDWSKDRVLKDSENTVTFDYDSTDPTTHIETVESNNPAVAISKSVDTYGLGNAGSETWNVTASDVGSATITATLNTGESTQFVVNVYKLNFEDDGDHTITVPEIPDKGPGDNLETGDIVIDIPILTPDGEDTITVTPEIPEKTVLEEGDNNINVSVDLDGDKVDITVVVPVEKKDSIGLYYTFTDDPTTGGWKVGLTSGFKAALNQSWAQQGQYLEWNSTESIPALPAVYEGKPVTNVSGMFMGMTAMEHLIISEWDTSNVVDMSSLFSNCTGLTQISLQNMDTSKVTTMNQMFYKCEKLNGGFNTSLDELETDSVTDMTSMFKLCKSLVNFDCDWNTSNVDSMQSMFEYCNKLYMIDLSSFTLKSGVNLKSMFNDCTALRTCWGSWANYNKFNDQWTTKLPDGVEFDYR